MDSTFSVWKTLAIGGIKAENLPNRVKLPFVSYAAREMARSKGFVTLPGWKNIRLVKVSVPDLGFDCSRMYPTTKAIYARAREGGLFPCPPEVAFRLSLQKGISKELEGIWLSIAMKQIPDALGALRIFALGKNCLGSTYAPPEDVWHYYSHLLFTPDDIEVLQG